MTKRGKSGRNEDGDKIAEKTPLISRLVDSQLPHSSNSWQTGKKIPASRVQILVNPASRVAVRSRFPSRYFTFFRIPQCILFKSPIPKIPSLQCRRFVQACKSLCSRKRHVDWLEKRGENGASQKERGRGRVGGGEREEKTPIRGSVCQRTKFPQKNNDFGQAHFFLPSPSPLSFFRPSTYPKGYYFYSP